MSSPRECKYCGRPVKEGKNCTCHESFYMRKNAELQQQLDQAQARVAELESQQSVMQLSELMRGLEIGPGLATMPPYIFYVTGKHIAEQAKEASDSAILRKQAEAVERASMNFGGRDFAIVREMLSEWAQHLSQQADELEQQK